jgi:hypothetical protein
MPETSNADDNHGIDKELDAAIKNNTDREEVYRKAKILCRHAKVLFGKGWELRVMVLASQAMGFHDVVMTYGGDEQPHLVGFSATCNPISAFETEEFDFCDDDEEGNENEEG